MASPAKYFFHRPYPVRSLDEALKKIFGWKRVASGVTFVRFFQKFNWEENTRIFVSLNQWFFRQLIFDNYILDVDSSVMTRYGEQQGAKVGYNPKKKGRALHHPLFAFCRFTNGGELPAAKRRHEQR